MTSLLLLLTPLWPLLLALPLVLRLLQSEPAASQQAFNALWLSAPLPALLLALYLGSGLFETAANSSQQLLLPGLLLGGHWLVDEVRLVFLLMTSLLWLLAGIYARGYMQGKPAALNAFALLWLLTQSGNLLLILAEDVASFYLGFALMTFAGYGLVIHQRTSEALQAGRIYLVLAVLGEALMLAGLLGTTARSATPTMSQLAITLAEPDAPLWLLTCLLLGFGVKAGLPFLHVWLPLAHPVAPTPASAVLSGAMIKAGLLGWWLVLPLGLTSLPQTGHLLTTAGLLAALAAALIGIMQSRAKSVLAYSSISQMGMITALLGAGLADQHLWPLLVPALLLFVAHHGLNKGSLFLAVGISQHPGRLPLPLLVLLLLLPALALTGLLGSGLMTKWEAKSGLYQLEYTGLINWLTLAAAGTTLLMARYLWLLWQEYKTASQPDQHQSNPWMLTGWLILLPLGLLVPWWLPLPDQAQLLWPDPQNFLQLALPVMLGSLLALAGGWLIGRFSKDWQSRAIPGGDLVWIYLSLQQPLQHLGQKLLSALQQAQQQVLQLAHSLSLIWPLLLRLTDRESLLRREAALTFALLLVVLAGLLLL
ncbi:complex I subunit 5 family protein [Marinospirillum alkaliphilum]|uniref:Proton-conducting membrane transporter n=1 Tax=Marinospirillum alkaliphilum DSM 21637 TaxID=1122209 RepID=A0A1K1YEN4_9GAMM|nr:complex I subunit 5 family protein [Marinospirillum alkaliphilum]SFX59820.1 Proton-conducting membrane transporter [Marinospirillum alkaliphilum DSM 21637]